MQRLRSFLTQFLLIILLPLFALLTAIAVGSVYLHGLAMRDMMAHNDQYTLQALAVAISEYSQQENHDLSHLLERLSLDHHTLLTLADVEGHIVYQSHTGQVDNAASQPGIAAALEGKTGTLFAPEGDVITFTPVQIGHSTWALVMQDPWEESSNPWLNTSLAAPLILVPAVALAVFAVWWGARRVILPLQKLDEQVAALGWGDYEAVNQPVGGIGEIEQVQQALARMAAQVRASQKGMHDYIGAVTQAQEEERKRLARELHDDTVQSLVALKQQSHRIRRALARELAGQACDLSQTEAALEELHALITQTINDVRRFSHALRPVYLEEAGLAAALEMLARDAGLQTTTTISFQVAGDTRRLPAELELALYRIAQEALTNTLKHAQAANAHIQLTFAPDQVTLRVKDDGAGFVQPTRVSDLVAAGHYGLMGIHERAQLVGAKLVIRSQPGQGAQIEVQHNGPGSNHQTQ